MLPDGVELQVNDLALVKADRYPQRNYGDRVPVEGQLETPPILEDFPYKDYLARQGIHSMVRRAEVTRLAERQASPVLYHLFEFKRHATLAAPHMSAAVHITRRDSTV